MVLLCSERQLKVTATPTRRQCCGYFVLIMTAFLMIVNQWRVQKQLTEITKNEDWFKKRQETLISKRANQSKQTLIRLPDSSDILVTFNPCKKNFRRLPQRRKDNRNDLPLKLEQDNQLLGKSCGFNGTHWKCRDCGLDCKYNKFDLCPLMNPERKCYREGKVVDWDEPTMLYTTTDHTASINPARQMVRLYPYAAEDGRRGMERLPCRGVRDRSCFDLSKCQADGPVKIFVYGNTSTANEYMEQVVRKHSDLIVQVHNGSEACLSIVSCNNAMIAKKLEPFSNFDSMRSHPGWNDGQNHFIFQSMRCFANHMDYPFVRSYNFQKAAISNPNFNDIQFRYGHDIMLPVLQWDHSTLMHVNTTSDIETKPRRFLLAFKGSGMPSANNPWYQHRHLAYRYWNTSKDDIVIDFICNRQLRKKTRYVYKDYSGFLKESKFTFCPGGSASASYRFAEVLMMGSIPVVTSDFVEPFAPDIDWSGCLVRISFARIVDLPRLLRESFDDEAIEKRRTQCLKLFRATIGSYKHYDDDEKKETMWSIDYGQQQFEMSMRVWAKRIKAGLRDAQEQQDIVDGEAVV
jgi:hypothetical protein